MNPVVHFEMPYENASRMATFYATVFGWQTQILGEEWVIMCWRQRRSPMPEPGAGRRHQWWLLSEKPGLAGAVSLDRDRRSRY